MKNITILALTGCLLCNCNDHTVAETTTATPTSPLATDTEALGLAGKVRSCVTVTLRDPTTADRNLSFDEAYAKAATIIKKYSTKDILIPPVDAELREAASVNIETDTFNRKGIRTTLRPYKDLHHTARGTDTVLYSDTTADRRIIRTSMIVLNKDRSLALIIEGSVVNLMFSVTTTRVSKLKQRDNATIIWEQTTTSHGRAAEPSYTDIITYNIVEKDTHGNILKALVTHTDQRQLTEFIQYRYTYYE